LNIITKCHAFIFDVEGTLAGTETLIGKILIKLSKSGAYTGIGILKSTNSYLE